MMTFEQFQATGRDVADLATIPHCAAQEMHGPGRVYLDTEWPLVIEGCNGWCLTIGNSTESSLVLEDLERDLYAFAVAEGYV